MTNTDKLKSIDPEDLVTIYKDVGTIQGTLRNFGIVGNSREK
jgi:hypothetical protein